MSHITRRQPELERLTNPSVVPEENVNRSESGRITPPERREGKPTPGPAPAPLPPRVTPLRAACWSWASPDDADQVLGPPASGKPRTRDPFESPYLFPTVRLDQGDDPVCFGRRVAEVKRKYGEVCVMIWHATGRMDAHLATLYHDAVGPAARFREQFAGVAAQGGTIDWLMLDEEHSPTWTGRNRPSMREMPDVQAVLNRWPGVNFDTDLYSDSFPWRPDIEEAYTEAQRAAIQHFADGLWTAVVHTAESVLGRDIRAFNWQWMDRVGARDNNGWPIPTIVFDAGPDHYGTNAPTFYREPKQTGYWLTTDGDAAADFEANARAQLAGPGLVAPWIRADRPHLLQRVLDIADELEREGEQVNLALIQLWNPSGVGTEGPDGRVPDWSVWGEEMFLGTVEVARILAGYNARRSTPLVG